MISERNRETTFAILGTTLYVATLSTQDNTNLLQQLKWGFKCTINWNNYQSKAQGRNKYLNYLIDLSFQLVNRYFVSSFKDNANRAKLTRYFLLKIEVKCYDQWRKLFWSASKK